MLTAAACSRPTTEPSAGTAAEEIRPFTGSWTATGTRQTLRLETGHWASIFRLSGSLLLTGKERLKLGFKSEVIGFSDNQIGMQGRSVWTDEKGDKVFSELRGEEVGAGKLISGRFLGGTGRYAGVSGEYTFRWQHLINNEDGEVSGRVVGLSGWARLGPATAQNSGARQ